MKPTLNSLGQKVYDYKKMIVEKKGLDKGHAATEPLVDRSVWDKQTTITQHYPAP